MALIDANTIFTSVDCPASVLFAAASKQYGFESVQEWEHNTLRLELFQDFKIAVPQINLDKISALVTSLESNRFYEDWLVFQSVCLTLSDDDPSFGVMSQATPEQISWGITEVLDNDSNPKNFSEDIKAYTRESLKLEGFLTAPTMLEFSDYTTRYKYSVPNSLQDRVNNEQIIKHSRVKAYIEYKKTLIDKYRKYL